MLKAIREFRQKLADGRVCLGAGITLSDPSIVEAIAPSVDFVWIDLEHTHLSYESVLAHLIAARAGNVAALVRVRASDPAHIKPLLDIGAQGIIVPQVRSADEVRRVVAACRYAPMGERGFGPRRPTNYGRQSTIEWMEEANRNVFVAVQIENQAALSDLERIASIEGLDSLALGPFDLSVDLGHQGRLDAPEVQVALQRIVTAAREANKFIGTGMGTDPEVAMNTVKLGVQWIQCGDDYGYMVQRVDDLMNEIRNHLVK